MKIITISLIGYNHPSQANWSYQIFKIDLIDTERDYNMSEVVKSQFGGEDRLRAKLLSLGINLLETKGLYTTTGHQKITGINKMIDIESNEVLETITNFVKTK